MKARFCIKKFLNKWATIVLKSGIRYTAKIVQITLECGHTIVTYCTLGCKESKSIDCNEIEEIFA